jgi:hypothetical protein
MGASGRYDGVVLQAERRISRVLALRTALLALLLVATSFAIGDSVIRDDGVGPVKIGMTLAELSATLLQKLSEDESGSENCFYVHARGHGHVSFMIEDGRLSRIDVDAPGIATSTGIQVGDSEAHARQVYGAKLKVTEHKYVDTGHYLTVRSADGRYGVRFETDKGKITMFYAGRYDAIQYVEGCE